MKQLLERLCFAHSWSGTFTLQGATSPQSEISGSNYIYAEGGTRRRNSYCCRGCFGGSSVAKATPSLLKKYTPKNDERLDYPVTVHSLRATQSGGGILDADDRLIDVVDDKEQIVAVYDEPEQPPQQLNNGGDHRHYGTPSSITSSSLDGGSPELYDQGSLLRKNRLRNHQQQHQNMVEVTNLNSQPIPGLSVMNGSYSNALPNGYHPKTSTPLSEIQHVRQTSSDKENLPTKFTRFLRHSARQSALNDRWIEAAQNAEHRYWLHQITVDGAPPPAPSTSLDIPIQSPDPDRIFREEEPEEIDLPPPLPTCPPPPCTPKTTEPSSSSSLNQVLAEEVTAAEVVVSKEDGMKASTSGMGQLGPASQLQKGNTRKIGRKMVVSLRKGSDGLGFSVTSRDNATDDTGSPIYIKSILPSGAAVQDGRLRAGDRLLEINGTDLTNLSQPDVVQLLRAVKQGALVDLIISRQETVGSPQLPRHLPQDKTTDEQFDEQYKQLFNFDIILNDSGSAGLGVSVKGRTSDNAQEDLGIFVKAIMHGGAAWKDGRLKTNDQLVSVNDKQLLGHSNEEAMVILRRAMQELPLNAERIRIAVLRVREGAPVQDTNYASSPDSFALETPHQFQLSMTSPQTRNNVPIHRKTPSSPSSMGHHVMKSSANCNVPAPTINVPRDEEHVIVDDDVVMQQQRFSGEDIRFVLPYNNNNVDGSSLMTYDDVADGNPTNQNCGPTSEFDEQFVRDGPGRRSMSEKRHAAAQMDATQTLTYQRIKHARQPSAQHTPPMKHTCNACQQRSPVYVPSTAPAFSRSNILSQSAFHADGLASNSKNKAGMRKSWSLESLSKQPDHRSMGSDPLVHEMVFPDDHEKVNGGSGHKGGKKVTRGRPTNDSFRAAVDRSLPLSGVREIGIDAPPIDRSPSFQSGNVSQTASQSPTKVGHKRDTSLVTQTNPQAAKLVKEERRLSTGGNFMKNLFRLGKSHSPSRLIEDEKERQKQEEAKKVAQEEQKRIKQELEKLHKQRQRAHSHGDRLNAPNIHIGPHNNSRPHNVHSQTLGHYSNLTNPKTVSNGHIQGRVRPASSYVNPASLTVPHGATMQQWSPPMVPRWEPPPDYPRGASHGEDQFVRQPAKGMVYVNGGYGRPPAQIYVPPTAGRILEEQDSGVYKKVPVGGTRMPVAPTNNNASQPPLLWNYRSLERPHHTRQYPPSINTHPDAAQVYHTGSRLRNNPPPTSGTARPSVDSLNSSPSSRADSVFEPDPAYDYTQHLRKKRGGVNTNSHQPMGDRPASNFVEYGQGGQPQLGVKKGGFIPSPLAARTPAPYQHVLMAASSHYPPPMYGSLTRSAKQANV